MLKQKIVAKEIVLDGEDLKVTLSNIKPQQEVDLSGYVKKDDISDIVRQDEIDTFVTDAEIAKALLSANAYVNDKVDTLETKIITTKREIQDEISNIKIPEATSAEPVDITKFQDELSSLKSQLSKMNTNVLNMIRSFLSTNKSVTDLTNKINDMANTVSKLDNTVSQHTSDITSLKLE